MYHWPSPRAPVKINLRTYHKLPWTSLWSFQLGKRIGCYRIRTCDLLRMENFIGGALPLDQAAFCFFLLNKWLFLDKKVSRGCAVACWRTRLPAACYAKDEELSEVGKQTDVWCMMWAALGVKLKWYQANVEYPMYVLAINFYKQERIIEEICMRDSSLILTPLISPRPSSWFT